MTIPIHHKYLLTVAEASDYFNIGESRLRYFFNQNKGANYLLWNGNKILVKRQLFEKFIDDELSELT